MNRTRWKAIGVLVATFLLGAVAGSAATHARDEGRMRHAFGRPGPDAREHFRLEAMTRRLDLTEDQRDRIEAILERHRPERDRIFEKCRPEHQRLRARVDREIRAVLTPEQRVRFERMERRRGRHKRPF